MTLVLVFACNPDVSTSGFFIFDIFFIYITQCLQYFQRPIKKRLKKKQKKVF